MNPERDKKIVEFFGGCWHERPSENQLPPYKGKACVKCENRKPNPDLDSWEGFGWLLEKMQSNEDLWTKFIFEQSKNFCKLHETIYTKDFINALIKPSKFADAVAEFIDRREEITSQEKDKFNALTALRCQGCKGEGTRPHPTDITKEIPCDACGGTGVCEPKPCFEFLKEKGE